MLYIFIYRYIYYGRYIGMYVCVFFISINYFLGRRLFPLYFFFILFLLSCLSFHVAMLCKRHKSPNGANEAENTRHCAYIKVNMEIYFSSFNTNKYSLCYGNGSNNLKYIHTYISMWLHVLLNAGRYIEQSTTIE